MGLLKFSFLFLISLYLSCAWIVSEKGNIEKDHPLTGKFVIKGLQGFAYLEVNHTVEINICFQRLVSLPVNYNQSTCSHFIYFSNSTNPTTTTTAQTTTESSTTGSATTASTTESTTGSTTGTTSETTTGSTTESTGTTSAEATTGTTSSTTGTTSAETTTGTHTTSEEMRRFIDLGEIMSRNNISFIDGDYTFGVYFAGTPSEKTAVSFALWGDSCKDGNVWDGVTCVETTPLLAVTKVDVKPGFKQYFTLDVEANTGHVDFATKLSVTGVTKVRALLGNAPSLNDVPLTQLISPHIGTWYVLVSSDNTEKGDLEITTTPFVCKDNTSGQSCSLNVTVPTVRFFESVKLQANDWVFYKVNSTSEKPLWVSIQAASASNPVQVYASMGQLPLTYPDISGCNAMYCDPVSVIKLGNDTTYPHPWFVGIFATKNDTYFTIWFDSICIPSCSSPRGTCGDNGACQCDDGYSGLDCSDDSGLQAQYIVLIIIASLVVASGVIGFVSWAYMRRGGKNSYEKVG